MTQTSIDYPVRPLSEVAGFKIGPLHPCKKWYSTDAAEGMTDGNDEGDDDVNQCWCSSFPHLTLRLLLCFPGTASHCSAWLFLHDPVPRHRCAVPCISLALKPSSLSHLEKWWGNASCFQRHNTKSEWLITWIRWMKDELVYSPTLSESHRRDDADWVSTLHHTHWDRFVQTLTS